LLETPKTNLSKTIKKLNCDFARIFNQKTVRKGSVIRGRYKSVLIEKEKYYFNVLRYICQNPVKQKICSKCKDYLGSFLNWIETGLMKEYLYLDEIKNRFGGKYWKSNFYTWINESKEENPFNIGKYKYFCGEDEWIKKELKKIKAQKIEGVKEKKKYFSLKINEKKLEQILSVILSETEKINIKLYIYSEYSGLTTKELIDKFDICSVNACWTRLSRFKKRIKENKIMIELIQKIEKEFFK